MSLRDSLLSLADKLELTALRARVAELEAERDRDFERGYDQGVCEALSTMNADDAAYCRKKFPLWDKAWKEAVGRGRYLAATPKEPDVTDADVNAVFSGVMLDMRKKLEAATSGHPWQRFLIARMAALQWLRDEMHETPEQSTRTMQMDPGQVRLLLMTADEAATPKELEMRDHAEDADGVSVDALRTAERRTTLLRVAAELRAEAKSCEGLAGVTWTGEFTSISKGLRALAAKYEREAEEPEESERSQNGND